LLKLSVYATLLLHFVACGWFLFAQFEGFGSNAWVPPASLANRDLYSYLFAYFVSLNMVAGIGNWVVPTSNIEFLFANTVCLIGIFAFACTPFCTVLLSFYGGFIVYLVFGTDVVGILDSIADMLLDAKRRIGQQMDRSLCMLEQQNVTSVTYARVQQYYQYVWSANEGVDVSETLHLLPDSLRSEVAVLLSSSMLERVSFFSRADPAFLLSVASMLKPLIAVPGQYIVHEGDPGSEMFFVQRGSAEVLVGADEKCVRELTAGDFFGEMALLFTAPRSASVRTTSHCDMFSLSQADLELLMRLFPDESERIKREATQKKRRQSYVKGVSAPGHRKRISIDRFAAARATALSINTAESSASPTLSSTSSALNYFNAQNQSPSNASQSTSPSNRRQAVKFMDSPPNVPESSPPLEPLSNPRFQLPPVARPSSLNRVASVDSTAESVESDSNKPPKKSQLPSLEALPALRQSTSLRRIRSLASDTSGSASCCSGYCSDEPFVFIRNESTLHCLWRFVIFILILYNIIGVPFRCAFCPYMFNLPLSLFDWAGDLVLLCNIWVVSRLAFYEHGVLITDIRRIRTKRLVRICLDLVACLPVLDCLILIPEWGVMSNYRLPRLLLFHQLYRLYDSDSIKLRTGRHAVEIVQLVCVVLLLSHFVACAYFAFTINSGFEDSYHWLPGTAYVNATMFQQYSRSFFFAIVYLTGMGAVAKPATIGQVCLHISNVPCLICNRVFNLCLVFCAAGHVFQYGHVDRQVFRCVSDWNRRECDW
jgi:CRP-like cAMP-binding protein